MRFHLPKLFEAPKSVENDVPVADGIRALCILGIMAYHIWQQSWLEPSISVLGLTLNFNWVVRCGYLLVDGMLTLSGFLIFLPYARAALDDSPSPRVLPFYQNRAARIFPSYYLCILVMLFLIALPNHEYGDTRTLLVDLLSHLTFTQVFFPAAYTYTHLNVVLWTLAVEMEFYLIFPWIARAFRKFPLITYSAMVAAAFAYRYLYAASFSDTTHYINQLPAMLDVYANGMMASYAYVTVKRSLRENRATALLFTLCSGVCLYVIYRLFDGQMRENGYDMIRLGQMERRYALSLSFATLILSLSCAVKPLQWLFGNRFMRFLSNISFQMYIWHSPLMLRMKVWRFPAYVSEANPQFYHEPVWQVRYTYWAFALSFLIGIALTYGFERPLARRLRSKAKRKQ